MCSLRALYQLYLGDDPGAGAALHHHHPPQHGAGPPPPPRPQRLLPQAGRLAALRPVLATHHHAPHQLR